MTSRLSAICVAILSQGPPPLDQPEPADIFRICESVNRNGLSQAALSSIVADT